MVARAAPVRRASSSLWTRRAGAVDRKSGSSRSAGSRVSVAKTASRRPARRCGAAIERRGRAPLAAEVAPLASSQPARSQPPHRPAIVVEPRASERAPDAGGRRLEARPETSRERLVEQARGLRLGEHHEQRIDARLDRALAQQVGAEAVNGADVRLFEVASASSERVRVATSAVARGALRASPQPQLELARRLLGEGDRDDAIDGGPPASQDIDDAVDEHGGLAGARRGFDGQGLVERSAGCAHARRRLAASVNSSGQLPGDATNCHNSVGLGSVRRVLASAHLPRSPCRGLPP